jgi:hypothetical protein
MLDGFWSGRLQHPRSCMADFGATEPHSRPAENGRTRFSFSFLAAASDGFDGVLPPLSFAIAAIAIGYALQIANGAYTPEALHYVTIGFTAAGLGVTLPRLDRFGRSAAVAIIVLALGLTFQIALLLGNAPGIYMRTPWWSETNVRVILALAALLVGVSSGNGRWARRLTVPILLGSHALLAYWTVQASPQPYIDVFAWHEQAFAALAAHHNPYAITMPNIYGSTQWYAVGLATPTQVLVGFPYPPLSFMIGWLGHWFGDYRFTNVVASSAAGAFMAYSRPGPVATAAASIFWFSPRLLFVLEQGWTEPQVIALLSATVFVACRARALLPWMLGLLLSIKQYTIFVVPFAFLLQERPSLRAYLSLVGKAFAIAAVLTLPWALWNLRAFFDSVVAFQYKQPFRADSLSYLAWSAVAGTPSLPLSTGFLMLVPIGTLALVRAARTPSGFAGSCALVFIAFFAFAKQAFCNYYMLVIGALCCAAASAAVHPGTAWPHRGGGPLKP